MSLWTEPLGASYASEWHASEILSCIAADLIPKRMETRMTTGKLATVPTGDDSLSKPRGGGVWHDRVAYFATFTRDEAAAKLNVCLGSAIGDHTRACESVRDHALERRAR